MAALLLLAGAIAFLAWSKKPNATPITSVADSNTDTAPTPTFNTVSLPPKTKTPTTYPLPTIPQVTDYVPPIQQGNPNAEDSSPGYVTFGGIPELSTFGASEFEPPREE